MKILSPEEIQKALGQLYEDEYFIKDTYLQEKHEFKVVLEAQAEAIKKDVLEILDNNYKDRVTLWEKLKEYFEKVEK
jgi:hypothetical protein